MRSDLHRVTLPVLRIRHLKASSLAVPQIGPNCKKEIKMKIFVGNLSFSATEEGLRSLFARYGNVASVNVIRDRYTGESRGFGFVEMGGALEGRNAIASLNRTDFEGRRLNVNEARPKEDRGERPDSGRQRGFSRY